MDTVYANVYVISIQIRFYLVAIVERVAPYKQLTGGVEMRAEIPKAASGKILRRLLKQEHMNRR